MVEIISVHVPKTAGISFRATLQQVYGCNHVQLDYALSEAERLAAISQARVIHGHFFASRYQECKNSAKWITWFRHPVHRVLSHYFFQKTAPAKDMRPDLAVLKLFDFAHHPEIKNTMSQYIAGMELTDFYFVGIQDSYTNEITDLARMLGWYQFSFNADNANRYSNYLEHLQEIMSNFSIVSELIHCNRDDMELYKAALSLRSQRRKKLALAS